MPRTTSTPITEPGEIDPVARLEEAVEAGERELADLHAKRASFSSQYRALLEAGDMPAAVRLRREHDAGEDDVFEAQVSLLSRRIALANAERVQARAEADDPELLAAISEAEAELEQATQRLESLRRQRRNHLLTTRDRDADLVQMHRERNQLLAEQAQAASAPVVRNLTVRPGR